MKIRYIPTETITIKRLQKILSYVEIDEGTECWNWQGHKIGKGYGVTNISGGIYTAHRTLFYVATGKVQRLDLVIDHACDNKSCVNPRHLRELTNEENLARGTDIAKIRREAKYCKHGHDEWKLVPIAGRQHPRRVCVACKRERAQKWRDDNPGEAARRARKYRAAKKLSNR